MKLSSLNTEQAIDVLCEITPYIANITGDKALLDELGEKFDKTGKTIADLYIFSANKCAILVSILLKAHREDVFGILSVVNKVPAKEIAKQNILDTIKQVVEIFKDKELLDFFKLWQQLEKTE